jgi:hypothetical protein
VNPRHTFRKQSATWRIESRSSLTRNAVGDSAWPDAASHGAPVLLHKADHAVRAEHDKQPPCVVADSTTCRAGTEELHPVPQYNRK